MKQEDFEPLLCHSAASATEVINHKIDEIDLCIFDLNLPDGSGYDLCQLVKKRQDIPVIFLTAYDDEVNVVMGLDMGADDYITKPFRIRELISRIKSVHRRYYRNTQPKNTIEIKNININILEGKVYKNGKEIVLTALEYRLFLIFANHIGQVLTRTQLLDQNLGCRR